jgi:hypothetical protein
MLYGSYNMVLARANPIVSGAMQSLDTVLEALAASPFRRRFRLGPKERTYLANRTPDEMTAQARRIIHERLAPAQPRNDGRQTPMRGHPVFIAQHATATCCRGCLAKWHAIPAGAALTDAEEAHAVAAIVRWLTAQPLASEAPAPPESSRQLELDFARLR